MLSTAQLFNHYHISNYRGEMDRKWCDQPSVDFKGCEPIWYLPLRFGFSVAPFLIHTHAHTNGGSVLRHSSHETLVSQGQWLTLVERGSRGKGGGVDGVTKGCGGTQCVTPVHPSAQTQFFYITLIYFFPP